MNMTINKIMELHPCNNGVKRLIAQLDNLFPKDKDFEVLHIIGGKNTNSDIVWLIAKMGYKTQALKYAIYCAELVLPIYEAKHNDGKSRKAIECAKLVLIDLENSGRVSSKNRLACREAGYDLEVAYARANAALYIADGISAYSDTAKYAASSKAEDAVSAITSVFDIVGIKIRGKMTDKLRQIIIEIN